MFEFCVSVRPVGYFSLFAVRQEQRGVENERWCSEWRGHEQAVSDAGQRHLRMEAAGHYNGRAPEIPLQVRHWRRHEKDLAGFIKFSDHFFK